MQPDGLRRFGFSERDIRCPKSPAGNASERTEFATPAGMKMTFDPWNDFFKNRSVKSRIGQRQEIIRFKDRQNEKWFVFFYFCVA